MAQKRDGHERTTGATYTTPATTAGDNGSGFSVVVSNSFGSATSSAALLSVNAGGYAGRPYLGSPVSLPGVLEAANYDLGGQGVAYNVLSSVNQGGAYRTSEAVSLEQTGGCLQHPRPVMLMTWGGSTQPNGRITQLLRLAAHLQRPLELRPTAPAERSILSARRERRR